MIKTYRGSEINGDGVPASKFFVVLFVILIPLVAYLFLYQNFKVDLRQCYNNTSCEDAICCQDYMKTWGGGD